MWASYDYIYRFNNIGDVLCWYYLGHFHGLQFRYLFMSRVISWNIYPLWKNEVIFNSYIVFIVLIQIWNNALSTKHNIKDVNMYIILKISKRNAKSMCKWISKQFWKLRMRQLKWCCNRKVTGICPCNRNMSGVCVSGSVRNRWHVCPDLSGTGDMCVRTCPCPEWCPSGQTCPCPRTGLSVTDPLSDVRCSGMIHTCFICFKMKKMTHDL